jgi:hypothetical protein
MTKTMKYILKALKFIIFLLLLQNAVFSKTPYFIENLGQYDSKIKFIAFTSDATIFLDSNSIIYDYSLVNHNETTK